MTSRAKRLANQVATWLADELLDGEAVTYTDRNDEEISAAVGVRPLWHPSFATKKELDKPIVTVRPASRGRNGEEGRVSARDVSIEIGVVWKLPPNIDGEAINDVDLIDPLDTIAEKIFDSFCRVDSDVYDGPDESHAGMFANRQFEGFYARTPTQPATLDNELLDSDQIFLTVITVPFQRME